MPDFILAGDAPAVAQVDTVDITAFDAATTYALAINGKAIEELGDTDAPTTEQNLVAAWEASLFPEFEEITAAHVGGSVQLTADTAGIPFTATSSVSGGTGTIGNVTNVTAADGPSVLSANNVKNASTGARGLPSGGDTLTFEHLAVSLRYNLEALAGLTLAELHIEASMAGQIGNPPVNTSGDPDYDEYRPLYLKAPATLVVIGAGEGNGSDLLMHDAGAVQCAWRVLATASDGAIAGLHPVILKGTHASNTLHVASGLVDVAPFAGETAAIATLTATGDAQVRTWQGVTLTTVNAAGSSSIEITSAAGLADITVINIYDNATVTVRGDNPITTINVHGPNATLVYLGSGTIGTLNLIDGPTLEATNNPHPFTVTTLNGSGTPTINDPNSRMTVTNAIGANNSNVFAWTWNLKPGRTFTLGAA